MVMDWKAIKQSNSKSNLINHIKTLHMALEWYARGENWAAKSNDMGGEIIWLGDDDPQYAALVVLGRRKPDPNYLNNWQKQAERRLSKDGNQQE